MIPNLTKDMIDIMQQLRKRLRSEFNIELRLSQSDIIENILQWVNQSKDQKTQLLFADLEDMMGIELRIRPEENTIDEPEALISSKIMYRGHPVMVEKKQAIEALDKSGNANRVYRGQIVA